MKTIGAFNAKRHLGELLERTERGEKFQITRHGRAVGKLVPPDAANDPEAIAAAVQRLKCMQGMFQGMSKDEVFSLKHEVHRS